MSCRDTEPLEEQMRADFSKQVTVPKSLQTHLPACLVLPSCQHVPLTAVYMPAVASHF